MQNYCYQSLKQLWKIKKFFFLNMKLSLVRRASFIYSTTQENYLLFTYWVLCCVSNVYTLMLLAVIAGISYSIYELR